MAAGREHGLPAVERQPVSTAADCVVSLLDPRAAQSALTGAKASNLARAAAAGLPVLPGFALTTTRFDARDPGHLDAEVTAELHSHWRELADGGRPLVVRSSSTVEDVGASSMAGQFRSVLGVRGWEDFLTAVRAVLVSSRGPVTDGPPAPMAVLVQPELDARVGGVMFGLDPMTGDRRRVLVEAVEGGPESLVSGTATASRYLLSQRGRIVERPDDHPQLMDSRTCRRLAGLARRAGRCFDGVQDIEWAIDPGQRLWLLQSRPVTAVGSAAPTRGPLLGPGPIGETFPDPLRPLEQDLWIPPLRAGVESALRLVGAVPPRKVAGSPVVTTVAGRVACDLDLLGAAPSRADAWRWLNPARAARRMGSAWRVGRLRAVLPAAARDVCKRVDADLAAIDALSAYADTQLVEVMSRVRDHLMAVHSHEILAGVLLPRPGDQTAAAVAMSVVHRGRALNLSDEQIVERWPVALALTPPRVGDPAPLPPVPVPEHLSGPTDRRVAELPAREALRLRARWLQELSARAATVLAERLARQHRLPAADLTPLTLDEVQEIASGWPAPADFAQRTFRPGPPLPSAFRMSCDGRPVRVRWAGAHRPGGRGAAEGRAQGRAVQDPDEARPGDVLVTRTLDPRLAGRLPTLGAVVSETGSVLSHLAILAREYHVPTVVGVHDALERYPPGCRVVVDGSTGEVRILESDGGGP